MWRNHVLKYLGDATLTLQFKEEHPEVLCDTFLTSVDVNEEPKGILKVHE